MNTRYRLTSRGVRGGIFYCVDKTTGKRTSLKTTNKDEAEQIILAKNQSLCQRPAGVQIECGGPPQICSCNRRAFSGQWARDFPASQSQSNNPAA
jgi:hypothetical protein